MRITFDIPDETNSFSFTLVMMENYAISTYTDCFNAQIIGKDVVVTGNFDEGYKRFPRTKSDWDQINSSAFPNT